jgi:hypothetical protein
MRGTRVSGCILLVSFTNEVDRDFASPQVTLAKVQWTFANWRKSWGYIGESKVDFRHWRMSYWRNSGKPKN